MDPFCCNQGHVAADSHKSRQAGASMGDARVELFNERRGWQSWWVEEEPERAAPGIIRSVAVGGRAARDQSETQSRT